MRKTLFLFDAARVFAMAVCVCSVAFWASCDPDPLGLNAVLESISITAPTIRDENRVITDKAGEFSYADKADVTVKMTFKNAEPAVKDSTIVIDLVSKVTWLTTVTKVVLTDNLVLTPILSGTDTISVKYGTLEVKDLFTVSNTSFMVTRSGQSVDMPFFGFNKVEAVGDATNEATYVTEDGKDYAVNTLIQTFKLSHSDGTTKEVEIAVLEARKDMPSGELVGIRLTDHTVKYLSNRLLLHEFVLAKDFSSGESRTFSVSAERIIYFKHYMDNPELEVTPYRSADWERRPDFRDVEKQSSIGNNIFVTASREILFDIFTQDHPDELYYTMGVSFDRLVYSEDGISCELIDPDFDMNGLTRKLVSERSERIDGIWYTYRSLICINYIYFYISDERFEYEVPILIYYKEI